MVEAFADSGSDPDIVHISYGYVPTPFGETLLACTQKGICSLEFADDRDAALSELKRKFPQARFTYESEEWQRNAAAVSDHLAGRPADIRFHLKGTPFQISVWKALLDIPAGSVASYSDVARAIGRPKAVRAVASAVAANPVSLLIPCHRVILATGETGNYRWGTGRKRAMLNSEAQ